MSSHFNQRTCSGALQMLAAGSLSRSGTFLVCLGFLFFSNVWAACIKMSLISELRCIFLSPFESFWDSQQSIWEASLDLIDECSTPADKCTKWKISGLSPTDVEGTELTPGYAKKALLPDIPGGGVGGGRAVWTRRSGWQKRWLEEEELNSLCGVMLLLACCIWCH